MDRLTRTFTLIELIMVVAIIGILASFLMPVMAKAKQKGYQTSCMSNLRQIGMATSEYADVFDGYSPPAEMSPPYGHFLNYVYVENLEERQDLLLCPAMSPKQTFNPYGGIGAYGELAKASFIMNVIREKGVAGWSYLGAMITTPYNNAYGWCGDTVTAPVRRNRVTQPATKIFITDSASGLTNSSTALGVLRLHETDHGIWDANENDQVNAGERQIGFQHNMSFNALFGDLHVEKRKRTVHEEWNAIQR